MLTRLLILPLLALLRRLPPDTAGRAGAAVGVLVFHLGVRRRVVRDNLRRALGLTGSRRREAARQSYATMGAAFLELWSFGHPDGGPERGIVRLNPEWQALQHRRHPGIVFLTLHLGSWDVAAASAGRILPQPFLVYAKAQHDALIDAAINRQRAAARMDVLLARRGERTSAVSAIRALRSGRPLGLLADQKPHAGEGVPAYFLGIATPCHAGPAVFARRAGVPIVPAFCVRLGRGRYGVFYGRPLAPGADEAALVQAGMDRLAAIVARFPGQYFWHHRRFKQTAELPPRAVEPWRARGLRLLVD